MRAITKSTTNAATTPPATAPAMIPLPTLDGLFMPGAGDGPAALVEAAVARALTAVDRGPEPGLEASELEAAKDGGAVVVVGGLEVMSCEVTVDRV